MSTSSSSPTARRRELAARLRDLRLAAGRTVEEVAVELMCSPAKISRLETADRGIQARDVRDLCRFYGVSESEHVELLQLAAEARKPGWWQDFRSLDEQVATFVGLETAAVDSSQFAGLLLPGLLQTDEYAQALVTHVRPPGRLGQAEIDEIVAVRGRRRLRLTDGTLKFRCIIDQAAFVRPVGSNYVMERELDHLVMLAERANIVVQVVPFEAGPYPGLEGSFQHLGFQHPSLADVVFVEGLLGNFLLDKSSEIQRYLEVYDFISASVALDADASLHWLREVRRRLGEAKSMVRKST